jgi:hypothetical protein
MQDNNVNRQGQEKFASGLTAGWGGRIRTCEWRHQKPLPYHLATPHHVRDCAFSHVAAGWQIVPDRPEITPFRSAGK